MGAIDGTERVAVIGGGVMGSGIAEVCARAGFDVTVVEFDSAAASRASASVAASIARAVSSGKLAHEEGERARGAISVSDELRDAAGARIAIEAITEDEVTKRELFTQLDRLLPDALMIASNTSSVPVMKLAAATARPERVLGLHFFNPAPVLPLVEIVRSIMTSPETLAAGRELVTDRLGKQTIDSQDRAGFVVNALLIPYLLSSIRMYESGFASKEDIDSGMMLGCAHPIGPLGLVDLIGLDTLVSVARSLYEEFRDPSAVVPPLVSRMVEAGLLGRKSGRGFYDYD